MKRINLDQLRAVRISKDLTQEALAEFSGVSTRTIQRVESGALVTPETAKAIAAALGVAGYAQLQSVGLHAPPPSLTAAPAPSDPLSNDPAHVVKFHDGIHQVMGAAFFIALTPLWLHQLLSSPLVRSVAVYALVAISVILCLYVCIEKKHIFGKATPRSSGPAKELALLGVVLVFSVSILYVIGTTVRGLFDKLDQAAFISEVHALGDKMFDYLDQTDDVEHEMFRLGDLMKDPDVRNRVHELNLRRQHEPELAHCVAKPFLADMTYHDVYELILTLKDTCIPDRR